MSCREVGLEVACAQRMTANEKPTRAPRRRVTLLIGNGEAQRPMGRSRDISVSGAFVETALRPTIDTTHTVSLVWGDDIHQSQARIVRHEEDGIGIAFLAPDQGFLNAVEDIVDEESP